MALSVKNSRAPRRDRASPPVACSRERLDALYARWNRREFAECDPVRFPHRYAKTDDRALVGFLAAALAYGRVGQILASVENLLQRLGPSPHDTLMNETPQALAARLCGFRHRFAGEKDVALTLGGLRRAIERHGSLRACFLAAMPQDVESASGALPSFVAEIGGSAGHLVPDPTLGSACKRLHLWLRWMVRRDEIDLGDWADVGAHRLVIPYDTHMQRLASTLGLAAPASGSGRAALELTGHFRRICPEDPVKYDFALTREAIDGATTASCE